MEEVLESEQVFTIFLSFMLAIKQIVNHVGFDDAKKNLLDIGCHHQKKGENINV